MSVYRHVVSITTDSDGAGTALSTSPVCGEILEIRSGAVFSSTASYVVTRADDGGTVLSYTANSSPWTVSPRGQIATVTGGTVAAALGGG